jgi:hypothetical protein
MKLFQYLLVFLYAAIEEYNREEYGQFRENNRKRLIEGFKSFKVDSYCTKPFTQTLQTAWKVWLEIGEVNYRAFEAGLVYGAVISAFLYLLVQGKIGLSTKPKSLELPSASEVLVSGDSENIDQTKEDISLVNPYEIPPETSVDKQEVETELKKAFKTFKEAKKALNLKTNSWDKLAQKVVTKMQEGGYLTLNDFLASQR